MRVWLAMLAGCLGSAVAEAEEPIKLEKIKAADVSAMIAGHKGKVVAVDVWADFCAPCKMKFPHLVKLHQEHAKHGLVCVSVSVDLEENFEGALTFLKKQKAAFPNYILWDTDDAKDKLEKTFAHTSPPIFHVFDRDGKLVRTWEGKVVDEEIDELIEKLLKK